MMALVVGNADKAAALAAAEIALDGKRVDRRIEKEVDLLTFQSLGLENANGPIGDFEAEAAGGGPFYVILAFYS